ncbi:MAG: LptF/LptG family permease [Candidatus Omnitrophica bacterium]|nr:LptF/LptG family permease [Candidatus Omnitrophota bacterium]
MKILRGYLLTEHAAPFAVTLCGLTGVLLIGNIIKFAELVISKGVSIFEILRLLIYLIPYMLSFTIPMAALIAMVMAFSRFSNDYELIALRASGVAPARLILPLLTAALMISGGVMLLTDRIVPQSHLAFRRQLKAIGIKRPAAYVEAGAFIKDFPPYVIFVYEVEGDHLSDVRIYEPKPNGPTRTIMATQGTIEPFPDERGAQLKLYDGTIDEWDPEHPGTLYKVSFGTYSMNLLLDADARKRLGKKLKEMTFRELRAEERQMAAQGIPALPIVLELHRRIASSFSTVVFVIFGLALGLGLHHHERLMTFVWVLGLFMLYYLSSIGANALALKTWLPPWLAMWLPNFLIGGAGAVQLWRTVKR